MHSYSLPFTYQHRWQDLSKLLRDGLCSNDKCGLINKNKNWYIYFGFLNYHDECNYMRFVI